MFSACSPICVTQPIWTSSISAGSRSCRATRPFSTCAARSSPRIGRACRSASRSGCGRRRRSSASRHIAPRRLHARWPRRRPSGSCSSTASGSRPASGSTCARRTPARSSAAWRRRGAARGAPRGRRRGDGDARAAAGAQARRDPRRGRGLRSAAATRRSRGRSPTRPASRSRRRASRRRARCRRTRSPPSRRASSPARWCRWTPRRPARGSSRSRCAGRSGSSARSRPFNFPLNLVAHKLAPALAAGCAVVLKPASADAALGAPARRARARRRGFPPAGSTSSSARRPRSATCSSRTSGCKLITFTGSGAVGWGLQRARAAEARQARARQRDAGDRRGGRRRRRRGREARRRTRSPSPARAASPCSGSTSSARSTTRSSSGSCPKVEALEGRRPRRRGDRRRAGDRRRRARARSSRGSRRRRPAGELLAGGDATDGLIRPTVIAERRAATRR